MLPRLSCSWGLFKCYAGTCVQSLEKVHTRSLHLYTYKPIPTFNLTWVETDAHSPPFGRFSCSSHHVAKHQKEKKTCQERKGVRGGGGWGILFRKITSQIKTLSQKHLRWSKRAKLDIFAVSGLLGELLCIHVHQCRQHILAIIPTQVCELLTLDFPGLRIEGTVRICTSFQSLM